MIGETADEHEAHAPAAVARIDDLHFEVDGRLPLDQLNRLTGLNVPEDAGFETIGGFLAITIGRVPETGAVLEHDGARYTVLDARPPTSQSRRHRPHAPRGHSAADRGRRWLAVPGGRDAVAGRSAFDVTLCLLEQFRNKPIQFPGDNLLAHDHITGPAPPRVHPR